MIFKRKKVGEKISDWSITLSERDMEMWGRKFGYCVDEMYSVDLALPDNFYEGYIGLGATNSKLCKENGIVYISQVDLGNKAEWVVSYRLLSRSVNGVRFPYLDGQPVYIYHVDYHNKCRTTKRNFIRDMMRDGTLALWSDRDEHVAKWKTEGKARANA